MKTKIKKQKMATGRWKATLKDKRRQHLQEITPLMEEGAEMLHFHTTTHHLRQPDKGLHLYHRSARF